jgi:hypothetical protein
MKIYLKDFEIVSYLPSELSLPVSHRNTLIYGRKDQKVWREIVILKKRRITK